MEKKNKLVIVLAQESRHIDDIRWMAQSTKQHLFLIHVGFLFLFPHLAASQKKSR
jgi:hypothetical protein